MQKIKNYILSATLKDTAVLFAGNAGSSLLAIVFTILVARTLGPSSWGFVAVVISFIGIVQAIFDLGLSSAIFRFKADAGNGYLQKLFNLRVKTALLAFALTILAYPLINRFVFSSSITIVLISAFGAMAYLFYDFVVILAQSRKKFARASVLLIANNLLRVLLVYLLYLNFRLDIPRTIAIFAFSPLAVFLVVYMFSPIALKARNKKIKSREVIGFSGFMGLNRIVGALQGKIDVILIYGFLSSYDTGIYSAAKQLAFGVPVLVGSFATVLAPRFADLKGQKLKVYFGKTVALSLLMAAGLFVGVLVSPYVIWLFGPQYHQSVYILQLLILSFVPFILSVPAVNILIYGFGKPKIIFINSLISLSIVYFGNLYLLPKIDIFSPIFIQFTVNLYVLFVSYSFAIKYLISKKS